MKTIDAIIAAENAFLRRENVRLATECGHVLDLLRRLAPLAGRTMRTDDEVELHRKVELTLAMFDDRDRQVLQAAVADAAAPRACVPDIFLPVGPKSTAVSGGPGQ